MRQFVLDASVALAWYLPETASRAALQWQERMIHGDIELLVPSFHSSEVANVLRTYVKRTMLDPAMATEIYEVHRAAPLMVVEPNQESVLRTALDYDATAYDAVYIALALEREVRLLTAERSTTAWVSKLKQRVERVS